MARGIDNGCFDNGVHIESRTIYLGDEQSGEIDAVVAAKFIKALHCLTNKNPRTVNVILNTGGGCYFNGMAIYDAIKHCHAEVVIYVLGQAMSMGSIILQAADTRVMYPNATLMLHDGQVNMSSDHKTFSNWAKYYESSRKKVYELFSERSGVSVAKLKRKCEGDFILTAEEAKDLNLIDTIYGE